MFWETLIIGYMVVCVAGIGGAWYLVEKKAK